MSQRQVIHGFGSGRSLCSLTNFLKSNAMRSVVGAPLPTPALPASGEGDNPSPAGGGGGEGECIGLTFAKLSNLPEGRLACTEALSVCWTVCLSFGFGESA